jgi:hypothetical protein
MEREIGVPLRNLFSEQVRCLCRIFAKHLVPDDVAWETTKALDLIYQQKRKELGLSVMTGETEEGSHPLRPHPGMVRLLDKLKLEEERILSQEKEGDGESF